MADIVEFPGAPSDLALANDSQVDIGTIHSQAFRDMEGEVCDIDRMAEIANDLIMQCAAREDSFHNLELAAFAVCQLAKIAKEFRANYQKRWCGELKGVT